MSITAQEGIDVLHVDDEPDFTELTGTFLEREQDAFRVDTAMDADAGLERIDDRRPDCVVSDYNMPGMNGLEFLQAVRSEYPDLPFILFTGKGSEDVASDAIAAGVTDYLQKRTGTEQFELLANRIRNAVRARQEQQRADRQEQLMRLTEISGESGGFELHTESETVLLTAGTRRIIGRPEQEELPLAEAIDLFHAEDQDRIEQTLARAVETREDVHDTWRLRSPTGDNRVLDITITPVVENGEVTKIRGAGHDITERKEQHRELRVLQQAIDNATVSITLADPCQDGDPLVYVNDEFEKLTGYQPEEALGRNFRFLQGEQTDPARVATLREAIDNEDPVTVELRNYRKDGTEFWNRVTLSPIYNEAGELIRYLGIQNDITGRKERERDLRRQERRFEALLEHSTDRLSITDAEGRYTYVSPSVERLLGHDPAELTGEDAFEYIHPDDRAETRATFEQILDDPDGIYSVEYRYRDAEGSWQWVESRGTNRLDDPAIEGVVINSREITDRKERERELQRNRDIMADMERLGDVGAWQYDSETDELEITDGTRRLFGLGQGEDLTLEAGLEALHPDDRAQLEDRLEACLETGEPYDIVVRSDRGDGERRWFSASAERISTSEDGSVLRGYIREITDEVADEQDLKRYRTLFNELPDPVVVYDEDGRYDLVNEAAAEIRDTPREELVGAKSPYLERIREQHPEDYQALRDGSRDHLRTELTAEFSGRGDRTLLCDLSRVTDETGFAGTVIVTRDITAREHRRKELREYETIIEALTDAVYVLDEEGHFTYVNDEFVDLVGYDRETILGNTPSLIKGAEAVERAEDTLGGLLSCGGPDTATFDVPIQPRDGDPIPCEDQMGVLPYEGDRFDGSVGALRDITDRIERERELAQTHDLMARMEQLADVGAWEYDPDTDTLLMTAGACRIHGVDPEAELTVEDAFGNFHPDDRPRLRDRFDSCLETGEPYEIDVRLTGPDGRTRWVTARGERVRNAGAGEVIRGYIQDVTKETERRRELERRTDLFEKAQTIADIGAWDHDIQRGTLTWTDQVYEIHGVSRDFDPSLDDVEGLYHPDDQPKLREAVEQAVTAGQAYDLEVRMTARDDETRWIRTVADPQVADGDVVRVRGTVHDITERKQREQELRRLKNQYQTLAEHFPNGMMFLFDGDHRYVRARGAELASIGISPDEIEGATPHDIFPGPIADDLAGYYTDTLAGNSQEFTLEIGDETYRTWTVPIRLNDETIDHAMGMSQNITDLMEQRAELERQNERLAEFASIVSHDLRGPLTVAEGQIELAEDTCESDHLGRAADAIDRSQSLIEDLLTLAREGEAVDEVEPVALGDVAERSWQTVETRGATLDIDASGVIEADRSRVTQLLENLYRNAVEHGPEDITVSVGELTDGFAVADTGPGIPEGDREEVFEAGYSTAAGGTGFGLRIVEQVATAHGWEVAVTESAAGGARFEVTGVEFTDR